MALQEADESAYLDSVKLPFGQVIDGLVAALGLGVVAQLAGVSETRAVREWAEGHREPRGQVAGRLRFAFRLVRFLLYAGSMPELPRAWFECPSPGLGNVSPIQIFRDDERLDEASPTLVQVVYALLDREEQTIAPQR
jgi:hypothetical protein